MKKSIQLRPRYKKETKASQAKIATEILHAIKQSKNINGKVINNNVYLKFSDDNVKYYSPELNITIRKTENGSIVKGVAGPNSKIWATFMVFYGLSVMLFIFGGLLGISEKMLGIDSYWILSVPSSIILFILVFIASKYGERLGSEQLVQLCDFLDDAVNLSST